MRHSSALTLIEILLGVPGSVFDVLVCIYSYKHVHTTGMVHESIGSFIVLVLLVADSGPLFLCIQIIVFTHILRRHFGLIIYSTCGEHRSLSYRDQRYMYI